MARNKSHSIIRNILKSKLPDGMEVSFETEHGYAVNGSSEDLLKSKAMKDLRGQVQLVFTSPPFPLNRKKAYDNKTGDAYKKWLSEYAVLLTDVLRPDGSIVIEIGNSWEPGLPVMSTLALEALLEFKKAANLYLCQQFVWYNPAKLPTPAQWVTVDRTRVKDAFTMLWWLSPTPRPKANNRGVLVPYSPSMRKLLKKQSYNAGTRPSEHVISATSFLSDNGGAIPPNVLQHEADNFLVGSNTGSSDSYHAYCKAKGLKQHPARMPISLPKFFIGLCTEPGDLVFDPFGGSMTTGAAAEEMGRTWFATEVVDSYLEGAMGRFPKLIETEVV
ncbi:MAG: site-specific DNA-methyltransferase [Flavobacteriales bacterium]|nr:MAG: site-specific DNA-methyltransferase [Flavobacteriales bacterium]